MRREKFAVVFDFDGTMTPKDFVPLKRYLEDSSLFPDGYRRALLALRHRYFERFLAGALTRLEEDEWIEKVTAIYVAAGLTSADVCRRLAGFPLRSGVADCLRWLADRQVPVAIVSYGIANTIRMVLEGHGLDGLVTDVLAAELAVDAVDGRFTGLVPQTAVPPSAKGCRSRAFAAAHGVTPEAILAVGDSRSDGKLGGRRECRLGLAGDLNEAADIASVMGEVIITDDFTPVQAWLAKKMGL